MTPEQKKEILEKANFRCAKCDFFSPMGRDLVIVNNSVLCSICNNFAPEDIEHFFQYINEKIQWQNLETFRKYNSNKGSHDVHKKGMISKFKQGKLMARPPLGYKVIEGNLTIDEENRENIRLIFEEFANGKSLNQISKTYNLSVNGLKKVLKNFTYLGKIKFNGQITQGSHPALISSELFNRVQQRFEFLDKKSSKNVEQKAF